MPVLFGQIPEDLAGLGPFAPQVAKGVNYLLRLSSRFVVNDDLEAVSTSNGAFLAAELLSMFSNMETTTALREHQQLIEVREYFARVTLNSHTGPLTLNQLYEAVFIAMCSSIPSDLRYMATDKLRKELLSSFNSTALRESHTLLNTFPKFVVHDSISVDALSEEDFNDHWYDQVLNIMYALYLGLIDESKAQALWGQHIRIVRQVLDVFKAQGDDVDLDQVHSLICICTHIGYALTGYNRFPLLLSGKFQKEGEQLCELTVEAYSMLEGTEYARDIELMAEIVDAVIDGCATDHAKYKPLVDKLQRQIVENQEPMGSWWTNPPGSGSMDGGPFEDFLYVTYHAAWSCIDGIRQIDPDWYSNFAKLPGNSYLRLDVKKQNLSGFLFWECADGIRK
jgi:hypothetical protein